MSKELRIGTTEPASGAPAFSVSRDSAGIIIGVRDNAAPQFAVSRDSEGLLLSAWPAPPAAVSTGWIKCGTQAGNVTFGMASVRPVSGQTASVRSSATTAMGSYWIDPYLVTAPGTIVVGDVLVMGVSTYLGGNTMPAGWTLIDQLDGGGFYVSLYTRTATIADVGTASYAVANSGHLTMSGHIWSIADGLDIDFSAFCYEPGADNYVQEVISADGFAATVGSVFCVFSGGNPVASIDFPETENSNPTWTLDGVVWGFISYAWHAVWGA